MTYDVMTPQKAQEWIDALDKYEKGEGQLCNGDSYCCLGVLAKENGVLGNPDYCHSQFATDDCPSLGDWISLLDDAFGLTRNAQSILIVANDYSLTWRSVKDKIHELFIEGKT